MTKHVLNPNHPVMRATDGQWFKIAALLLLKLPEAKALITSEDVMNLGDHFGGEMPTIVVNDQADGMHVYLVRESEARFLARNEGGLPV
ncbi:hypothetical protein [Paraburkholderia sacchari]|uniref:hypothetical protein n=1 Tax=Paraburkholderia sacchari TaxID=159450 RepID=UPI001BCF1319|nr:hypothetical protein [Paraburkholderia sacchari]